MERRGVEDAPIQQHPSFGRPGLEDIPLRPPVLILGCGYTGLRVARLMMERGHEVLATARDPSRLEGLRGARLLRLDSAEPATLGILEAIPKGCLVLHSIPLTEEAGEVTDPTAMLMGSLGSRPARVVYLSTTGVYGAQEVVDERTQPAPRTSREMLRVGAEQLVQGGGWPWMILRPAAIYGPGRGIHVSLPRGEFRLLEDGANWVSRIHVDDLAEIACRALISEAEGAWPVADEEPARSKDIAEFVAKLLGCDFPASSRAKDLHMTRRANRRVNGKAVLSLLDLRLKHPSYRTGIPASLDLRHLKC